MANTANMQLKPGSWQEAAYDVAVGTKVGASHGFYHAKEFVMEHLLRPFMGALGVSFEENKLEPIDGLKVVGVGFGLTGTVSLVVSSLVIPSFTWSSKGCARASFDNFLLIRETTVFPLDECVRQKLLLTVSSLLMVQFGHIFMFSRATLLSHFFSAFVPSVSLR